LTLLVYEWKCGKETKRTLDRMGLLFDNNHILRRLMIHLTMDDPIEAKTERAQLEKRIRKIEEQYEQLREQLREILILFRSRGRLERLLETKISLLSDS